MHWRPTMKICTKCQLEFDDKYAFCDKCGGKLQEIIDMVFCPYCGNKIETSGEYCPFCGKLLVDAEPVKTAYSPQGFDNPKPINITEKADSKVTKKQNSVPVQNNEADTPNNDNSEEKAGSIWGTIIELVLLLIGCIFAKSCAHALLKSQYRRPTAIISIFFMATFMIYILYQLVYYFKKKR